MKSRIWSALLPRSAKLMAKGTLALLAALTIFLGSDLLLPQSAAAYPFWAQQNYESPREATGRIVCANCHLGAKPTELEVPQSVLPDTVFKAVVKIPYDTNAQQVLATGDKGGLNVGAVLVLPEGFTIAPSDRIPEEMQEEVGPSYLFQTYSETQDNIILVGPLPGEQYQEIVFPVLSPNPATDKSVSFGKYSVHVGGNRGRGQIYPAGNKSNNAIYNASASGVVSQIAADDAGGYNVTIQADDGSVVVDNVPAGPTLVVTEGDVVTTGAPLNTDPNVGGFGQKDAEIVLQSPTRIKGLIAFMAAVMLSQVMLVLKKKQIEKVQAAEMSF
ncbi:MAG: apocytochrome f [Leptolyngbya sp. DLM2.Bin15]|nr:MAG: apocytochrome f [Leptolyngbya sp. DLM2.Bin15]